MQLTLEHVAKYLPYELQLQYTQPEHQKGQWFLTKPSGIDTMNVINMTAMLKGVDYKPILRPLSQLVQEIEHNGEVFVPIIELACDVGASMLNDFQVEYRKGIDDSQEYLAWWQQYNYTEFLMYTLYLIDTPFLCKNYMRMVRILMSLKTLTKKSYLTRSINGIFGQATNHFLPKVLLLRNH